MHKGRVEDLLGFDANHHFLPVFRPELLKLELDRADVSGTILVQQVVDTADEHSCLLA